VEVNVSYAVYDFTESLACARRDNPGAAPENTDLVRCVAAYGDGGGRDTNDYEDWYGGFLVELKDGRFAYVSGWCDTTGWGCQDGASCEFFDKEPNLGTLERRFYGDDGGPTSEWDRDPADLNKWIADGFPERW
jgi:hypothetical protein